jgi:ribulose-5-phosphate 4-epimerase/fuculose-1-phosphate aldolase
MIDEGYIKYQCHWLKNSPLPLEKLREINQWRDKLYSLGLIGEYENGIGFGNLSIRTKPERHFIITGTKTGGLKHLTPEHYTTVIDFDWHKNYVTCIGPIQASSEALTHAAVYIANPNINAVIHVHHLQMWQKLLNQVTTTNPNCAYGTPEIAEEIIRLSQTKQLQQEKILVMSGHKEGIITFGTNLAQAGEILLVNSTRTNP